MSRYFLRFRHSDTGLTPTFTFFKKASDLLDETPPSIVEVANGTYYFDYTPTFDVVFEVDGGASIPTEEVQYISDVIGPKDLFLDEPTSQVKDDVWNDVVDRAPGTKGDMLEGLVNATSPGSIADAVWDELIASHQGAGSMGLFLNDVFRVVKNKGIINKTTKKLDIYDDTGAVVVFSFDLKDDAGVASATKIFQKIPL
jgi:hypothetical protein